MFIGIDSKDVTDLYKPIQKPLAVEVRLQAAKIKKF